MKQVTFPKGSARKTVTYWLYANNLPVTTLQDVEGLDDHTVRIRAREQYLQKLGSNACPTHGDKERKIINATAIRVAGNF